MSNSTPNPTHKAAGWYAVNPNDPEVRYWDGQQFVGTPAPRTDPNTPIFNESFATGSSLSSPYGNPQNSQQPYSLNAPPKGGNKKALWWILGGVGAFLVLMLVIVIVTVSALLGAPRDRDMTGPATTSPSATSEPTQTPDDEYTPTPEPSNTDSSSGSDRPSDPATDAAFTKYLKDAYPAALGNSSDESIVKVGKSVCTYLDTSDGDFGGVITILNDNLPDGVDKSVVGGILGASVGFYCDEYAEDLRDFVSNGG